EDIKDSIVELLTLTMQELVIGPPNNFETDVPTVIDENAKNNLLAYRDAMQANNKLLFESTLPQELIGHYVAPCLFNITTLSELQDEQFGPFLHVMTYRHESLHKLIEDINELGYGLTLGIHSRIDETIRYITDNVNVGNIYVNRNMIGAVVGSQPFGGEGLSGTGPKAGGPYYLQRFCAEKTVSANTSAIGGNAQLLNLNDS
ncbi:MAG: aldehyde dehydrogenase family protein, partial [Gammaproteobacteria bacterium]|nr:aldehyde dehydrogenase family protein [Gammaproteobacteria bacterium]